MKILHVISSLDRKAGGTPVALVGLAIAQKQLGADVTVASTYNAGADLAMAEQLRAAGVAVELIGPAGGKFQRHPEIVPTLRRLIAAADFVHVHTLWEEIQHQAAVIARRHRKPYAFVPQGMLDPWSLSQSKWKKRAYLAWRLRRDVNGAAFIHVLNADEGRLIAPLKLKTRTEIIPNGIDPAAVTPLPPPDAFRQKFPQLGEAPFALFLSRLHYKKGLDYLADAFTIVAERRPDVKLVVAGPDDGAEKDFDARIAAAGLSDRVLRVGPLYGPDKLAALAAANHFVLPSRQEGHSLATIEAIACGLPAVISDACHFPEVGEAGAGRVVALEARAIAGAMLEIFNDAGARQAASDNAQELAQRYTWQAIARQTFELYGQKSLAILANAMTPYRIALHRRIVREIPGLKLYSLYTHARSNAPWKLRPPAEIGPVSFTQVGSAWKRGGAIIEWMRRNRPSAVMVNGYADPGHLRVLRWCRRHRVPVMLWGDSNVRADLKRGPSAAAKRALVGWAIRQADAVLACGSLGQAYFEKYGAKSSRIFWMPYEPDYALIRNVRQEQIAAVQEQYGWRADRRRMVYSGRLIAIKRVDLLLTAFAAIASQRPDWDLVIVGEGDQRRTLQASVPPGLQSRITWTGFVGDQSQVSAIYRACDVLVHPADVEPWALVINEAAAAGLAIIASDVVGAAAELVRDGANGRLFPAGDIAALRQVLLEVTAPARTDALKAASATVLAEWQQRGDPVDGLRRALAATTVR